MWYHGIIMTKSAGNRGNDDLAGCAAAGYSGTAVSAPGAAATIVSVGAMSNAQYSVQEIQAGTKLKSDSSGGLTGDGRIYPRLVAPNWACGAPAVLGASFKAIAAPEFETYVGLGETSGAQPVLAGAAAVVKHWYLRHHVDTGNAAGLTTAMLLNLADGYSPGGTSPAEDWGLGRFRARLFDADSMSAPWGRDGWAFPLGGWDEYFVAVLPDSDIAVGIRRLRITLWWPELNTGVGETPASITAWLVDPLTNTTFAKTTSTGDPIRFAWECGSSATPLNVPGLLLYVLAEWIPAEVRQFERDYRTVYVASFWETGSDTTTVSCDSVDVEAACASA